MTAIVAQVRNRDLERVGVLSEEDLVGLKLFPVRNGVGTWELVLPHLVRDDRGRWVRHTMAEALAQPGNGIVVELPGGRRFSGPVVTPEYVESVSTPRGEWKFSGISDTHVLADRRAFPDPAIADAAESSKRSAYDTRSGPAETLMHAYVESNIGPAATHSRRDARLRMGANLGRGKVRPKSARFPSLLELCQELAKPDGLLFEVVQVGDSLEFRTGLPEDLTGEVRLDVGGDTLDEARHGFSGPAATQVIVMGQGEAEERQIITRTTDEALVEAEAWRRTIETVVDARGTEELAELVAKGDEVLAASGSRIHSLSLVPTAYNSRTLGSRWWLGDLVTVNVGGAPVTAAVTAIALEVTPEGVFAKATVGDVTGFDPDAVTGARIGGVESRVEALERTAEGARPTRGTAAQRDAIYGVPTSPADQARLANLTVRWWNTTHGWEESYYAPVGVPGLAVPGLVSSFLAPAGWYPVGSGPYVLAEPTAQFAARANSYVGGWDSGAIRGRGGNEWFDVQANGLIRLRYAGVYDVNVWTTQQPGSGTANYHLRGLAANQSTVDMTIDAGVAPLYPSLASKASIGVDAKRFGRDTYLGMWVHSGSLALHGYGDPRGQFRVRYVGPPLAST